MTINIISAAEALASFARSLGLHSFSADRDLIALISASLRRTCMFMAPCGRSQLERAVRLCLSGLGLDEAMLAENIEAATEELLAFGDLLEMRQPGEERASFIIRPSAFHYVNYDGPDIVLLGTGLDEATPIANSFPATIRRQGSLRFVPRSDDLQAFLKEAKIPEISLASWLHLPRQKAAAEYLAPWVNRLEKQDRCGTIDDLKIIKQDSAVKFYKGRWAEPGKLTGHFIGRRPQAYGADLWCLVQLDAGHPVKFIDLTADGDKWRPCDIAWHIQMAMDAERGAKQRFRVQLHPEGDHIEFFSPLPSWAERKMMTSGVRQSRPGCLFCYVMRAGESSRTIPFLQSQMWLAQIDERAST